MVSISSQIVLINQIEKKSFIRKYSHYLFMISNNQKEEGDIRLLI